MSQRNPLTPAAPRRWNPGASPGMVFDNADGHVVRQTYFYVGPEHNDNVTGEPHPVVLYRFLCWQGDLFFRTRLTEAEIARKQLVEMRRGLDHYQMGHVAQSLFRHWESDEYRSIEIHQLKEGTRA